MIRNVALVFLVGTAIILAACGQPEVVTPARDGAEVTATYEAMKASILATRRGESPQTPTSEAQPGSISQVVDPTVTSSPTEAVVQVEASATSPGTNSAALVDVMSFFPTDEQLPADFYMWQDREVSFEEVVASNANPDAYRQRVTDWGFRQLHSRGYELPHSLTITDRMNIFFVTVYEWGSPEQASAAAAFNAAEALDCHCWTNVQSATVPAIGDEVIGQTAEPINADGFHIARIYIRYGTVVVRIEAHADTVNPLPEAIAFVEAAYGSR